MYLLRSPSFRFWATVYAFPAFLPMVMNLLFIWLVRDGLVRAMGPEGSGIASNISSALTLTFAAMIVLANICALWHAATGKPAIPVGPRPPLPAA